MPDGRRGQGMKHKLATVLSECAPARLAGVSGPATTQRFARHLSEEERRAPGAWRDPEAGRRVVPSDSTLCRVMADTDPDALNNITPAIVFHRGFHSLPDAQMHFIAQMHFMMRREDILDAILSPT